MEDKHQELKNLFEQVMEELLELLNSLTEEQLNQTFVAGKWTPGQLGLHLYKSYASIYTMKGTTVEADRPIDFHLPLIKSILLNFDKRYQAPQEVIPSADQIMKEKLLLGLKKRVDQHREVWNQSDLSRLCTDFAIPQYGPFTRLEWLGFNTYHTLRHLQQLTEQLASSSSKL
ncbi:DinB family protein [Olivibacter sp. CPCC 100613]|uniref:DinB family protein n=1 Tax=Olivibacter sp. CPCC 100613 TaxID=3079931 RepID=UPI002FF8AE3E